MDNIMEMGLSQLVKASIQDNLKREDNMAMDNLDGKMDLFIEDTIIKDKEKDKVNISMESHQVFRKEFGKTES